MRWLEFLGIVPKGDHSALRIDSPEYWSVDATMDGAAYFRALARLAPEGAIAYLEGSTEDRVPKLLTPLQIANPKQVAIGTIMPASDLYHVPATPTVLASLAELIEQQGITTPAIHTVLYRGDQVLLSWYDAFSREPMALSSTFSEAQVQDFAGALGVDYRWHGDRA